MINVDDRLVKTGLLKQMKPNGWAILTAICVHMNAENKAWPGKKRLQELTGLGRDSTTQAIQNLKKLGLLESKQRTNKDGRRGSNMYRITTDYISIFIKVNRLTLEDDTPCTENQYTDDDTPRTDLPYTDKPATENQYALSINHSLEVLNNSLEVLNNTHTQGEFLENEILAIDKESNNENLPPQEIAIRKAMKKGKQFFKNYPAMKKTLKDAAKITDPDFDILNEFEKFVRHHGTESHYLQVIETKISGPFGKWLFSYKPKINRNGKRTSKQTKSSYTGSAAYSEPGAGDF